VHVDVHYPGFGSIEVDGTRYDHDVIIDAGRVRKRRKKPSRPYRDQYGHTPLSAGEDLPWSPPTLVIGTGASGRLPIMPEVRQEAVDRSVELVTMPTRDACDLLRTMEPAQVFAVLHVTC